MKNNSRSFFLAQLLGLRVLSRTVEATMKTEKDLLLYPELTQKYSNEDFDRTQQLATELTDCDRASGNTAPHGGYSAERFAQASKIVRDANFYSDAACERRAAKKEPNGRQGV